MAAKLSLVRDTDTPAGPPAAGTVVTLDLPGRRAALARERENARVAVTDPDVAEQQKNAIARALRELRKDGADPKAILADLVERMLILGYVNGAADQRQAGHLELTDTVLAEVIKIETRERAELPAKERALKAVRS